jgi:hypothetical protein
VRGFATAGVGVLTTLAFLALATPAAAQQGVTTGAINGQVLDTSGAPLAGATVTIRNVDTGASRELQSNATGRYSAGFLQTGRYTVAADFPPNPAAERGPVRVNLGETVVVDLVVQPVEVEAIGVVIAPEDQVDVSQGGIVELIDQEQIESLPTLGRDFTDFINLSGLVSPATGTGTGGQFSLAGGRTSGTSIQIDGADANNAFFGENRGSSRLPFSFSLESIKEFQIVTNGFDVEFGNFSGGVVNVVTKGGTNEFEGSGFIFARDANLTKDDFIGGPPADFSNQQFGFQLSGPIAKDKAHFFFSLDGQQQDLPEFALVGDQWCTSCAAGEADAFLTEFRRILRDTYGVSQADLDGNFGQVKSTSDEIAIFGRVDVQMNERNSLTLRHNFVDLKEENDRINNEEAVTHGGSFEDTSNSFLAELTSVMNEQATAYNTFRFLWSYEDRPRDGNNLLPEVDIEPRINADDDELPASDVEYFGDGIVFRNRLEEGKFQIIDNVTWALGETGAHTLKIGTNNTFTNVKNLFWLLGNGIYSFDSLEEFENGDVDNYFRLLRADAEPPFADMDLSEYSFYVQDEIQVNDNVILSLGLRYDSDVFDTQAVDNDDFLDAFGEFGLANSTVPEDRNNWSPRVSLTIDPRGDATAVFRTGFGLFYGNTPLVLHGNVLQTTPPLLSLFCGGGDAPPPDYAFFRQDPTGGNNPTGCVGGGSAGGRAEFTVWDEAFENPETWKFNVGYEQVTDAGWRFSGDLLFSQTSNNFNVINVNQRGCDASSVAGGEGIDCEPIFRTAVDNRPVFVAQGDFDRFDPSSSRIIENNDFQFVYLNESTAESRAVSFNLKGGKRFDNGARIDLAYTYNDVKDNSSFFCCTSNEGFRIRPTAGDPNFIGDRGDDTDGTWGPADFERKHVWIVSGGFEAPGGIDISGIWRSQRGRPFTLTVSGDVNGDGETFNDRAPIFSDLEFADAEDAATWASWLSGGGGDNEAFQCLREQRGRIAGRNTCHNPWFHSVDMHIAKAFEFANGQEIEFIADLFNVLNGLNDDWGRLVGFSAGATGLSNQPLRKRGYNEDTNKVIYALQGDFGDKEIIGFDPLQFQVQLGFRYRF